MGCRVFSYVALFPLAIALVGSILHVCVHAQPTKTQLTGEDEKSIDEFVQATMGCWNVPGFSMALVRDGQTVLARAYGKAVIEKDVPATEKTVFPVASMTKQFSVTLLAMLLKENGIPWRTKVKDILDDFQMPSDYMTLTTTLEDIVAHRTGLGETMNLGQFTMKEGYDRIRLYQPAVGFREELLYSGTMFSVSGIVAEKLGGKSWDELMRERIFDPLGMDTAFIYDLTTVDRDDLARPYTAEVVDGPLTMVDPAAGASTNSAKPAGSVAASAVDMGKYIEFLTNRGEDSAGNTVLPGAALDELFQPLMILPQPWLGGFLQLPVSPFPRRMDAYAHGWILGYYRGLRNVYHFGDIIGFDGLLSLFPAKKIGVYTNANGPNGRRAVLANILIQDFVTDILLGVEPWLDKTSVCDYRKYVANEVQPPPPPPSAIDKTLKSSRPLKDYTGTFGNLPVGDLIVSVNTSSGLLQIDFPPLVKFALYPTNVEDRFAVENFGHLTFMRGLSTKDNAQAVAQFSTGSDGVIDSVTMGMFGLAFERDLKYDPASVPISSDCSK